MRTIDILKGAAREKAAESNPPACLTCAYCVEEPSGWWDSFLWRLGFIQAIPRCYHPDVAYVSLDRVTGETEVYGTNCTAARSEGIRRRCGPTGELYEAAE